MSRKIITLENDFHDTSTTLKVSLAPGLPRVFLSEKQASQIHDNLCGSPACTCSNSLGMSPAWQPCGGKVTPSPGGYWIDLN